MFIGTAIRDQSKLHRSEMSPSNHCAPTEPGSIKNRVSINISSLRDVPMKTLLSNKKLDPCYIENNIKYLEFVILRFNSQSFLFRSVSFVVN
jgi:hypothetical protein